MRTFMSPAASGATARTRGVPNDFQGWCSQQKRFLSVERKEPSDTGVVAWPDRHIGPRRLLRVVIVAGVSSFVAMTIAYRRLDKAPTAMNRRP
ncbi:uncharacterized protein C2845_PM12G24370 [Panicum miliaceum]|uniref:Uncharacterized protein n=1 Tax=Panicum miliaceum TaxID=4540 RepID=A0A3L6QJC3_PANMI|nr:uncharacterized protein C2845_PM12G24370 [Panicum miliaceum]